jgi:integrase
MKNKLFPGVGIRKDHDGKGSVFWRVRLGKKFTGGKFIKKTFPTSREAVNWVKEQLQPKKESGTNYFKLSPSQVGEAINAYKRIDKRASLTEIVDYWLKHACPIGGTRSFEAVADEFIKSREAMNCKSTTMRNYRSSIKILKEEFGEVEIHDIRKADIEDWLVESEWEPRTRKNYIVTLTTIFNYAIGSDYCATNPAERVPRPILEDNPPGILTPAEAEALLAAAMGCLPNMVAPIAIGLFAGLRRSEICALDWSEIDLQARTIEVKAAKAKTRQRRIVAIQENLWEWLQKPERKTGPVAPDVDVFGEKLKHLVAGRPATDDDPGRPAVVKEWPHNGLRHSFGSYFFGKTKNENLTAAEMGNSPGVVFRHYRALVKQKDVESFWQITPDTVAPLVQPDSKARC